MHYSEHWPANTCDSDSAIVLLSDPLRKSTNATLLMRKYKLSRLGLKAQLEQPDQKRGYDKMKIVC